MLVLHDQMPGCRLLLFCSKIAAKVCARYEYKGQHDVMSVCIAHADDDSQ